MAAMYYDRVAARVLDMFRDADRKRAVIAGHAVGALSSNEARTMTQPPSRPERVDDWDRLTEIADRLERITTDPDVSEDVRFLRDLAWNLESLYWDSREYD